MFFFTCSVFALDSKNEGVFLNKQIQNTLKKDRIKYELPALSVSIKLPEENNSRNYISGYYSLSGKGRIASDTLFQIGSITKTFTASIIFNMYFDLSNKFSNIKNEFITIHEVNKNDDLKEWIQPQNEGFQIKEGDDHYRKLNADILKKDSNKFRHFVAYYQNNVASAGTLFLSKDAVMIHNLATKTNFTKRGIGTALTLHMMRQAKQLGFKHCFLDSSEDSFNLYKKIGFKTYSTTTVYTQ